MNTPNPKKSKGEPPRRSTRGHQDPSNIAQAVRHNPQCTKWWEFSVTPVDAAVRHSYFLHLDRHHHADLSCCSGLHLHPHRVLPHVRIRMPHSAAASLTRPPLVSRQLKKQEQREKTRARMARYRQKMKELPDPEKEEVLRRARAARAKYREKNRTRLLDAAKGKRRAEFELKHGVKAYEARLEAQRQRQLEAHERPRRRSRVRSTKKPKPPPSSPTTPRARRQSNADLIGAIDDGVDSDDFDSH
ncbi:hypothetical protein C8F04DRAFT_1192234 [Mycena alexandri]|uniref:Uncharacterized protein n=1 Tax=Mycena alexandri TaxID=1745969 RepID=A0AAD6S0N3_9AGAR|nr:hypothetical protein C8F04DRAFT_1198401 [Mycena alexandri]KAJ7018853.1 hypothetical protein C8F04DRAFT_1198411 [Mycena alexandri]KAJ7024556.1 hypothetical protein C8F04DRAFT_1192234 [Mycena alexandri]